MTIHGTVDSYFTYQRADITFLWNAVTDYWTLFNETQTCPPKQLRTVKTIILLKNFHIHRVTMDLKLTISRSMVDLMIGSILILMVTAPSN